MTTGTGSAARIAASAVGAALAFAWSIAASGQGISLDGFAQSHVAARTSRVACPAGTTCDFPAAELRGQLKAEGKNSPGDAAFLARFDLLRDVAIDDTRLVTPASRTLPERAR